MFQQVDAIESQVFLKHQKKIHLSEQELLECNNAYPNAGCVGGGNFAAFNYIIDNGIAYQKDYPYKRYVEKCKNDTIPKSDIKFKSYTKIEHHNEIALRQALGKYYQNYYKYTVCPQMEVTRKEKTLSFNLG